MSVAAESPSPSPSSPSDNEDFADLLDAELELASAAESAARGEPLCSPSDDEEEEEDGVVEIDAVEEGSNKRRRVEEHRQDQGTTSRPEEDAIGSVKDVQIKICPPHPGLYAGLCIKCGKSQDEEDVPGVTFDYIRKGLRLGTTEMDRLHGSEVKNLLRERKLVLILDLDLTLINSTRLHDISTAEMDLGIRTAASKNDPNRSLFTLQGMQMLTKLRPFVRKFLEEASNMFNMYIFTMGDKAYAIEIAKLLDPGNVYVDSKVISNSDCSQPHQKGLDVVPGDDNVAVILDDTEFVWQKHKENLILMERYHYFAASCPKYGFSNQSLSELMQDERESDGALATILDVLKRIHTIFFDSDVETALSSRDVRQVIKRVRQEVLQGCKVIFSRVFPSDCRPQDQIMWRMAEQLGAVCCFEVDPSVTHVVAVHAGTEKARWALNNEKFLLHPRWIEACNYRWHRQPEEGFPVTGPKEDKGKEKVT